MKKKGLTSTLKDHKHIGKRLVSPWMTLPKIAFRSWGGDRLPEHLWACLIRHAYAQNEACDIFREIAAVGFSFRDTPNNHDWSLSHSQLAILPPAIFEHIIATLKKHTHGLAPLRPLLLYDYMPAKPHWQNAIGEEPIRDDWNTLGAALEQCLDGQSQESTDVRWLSVMFQLAKGSVFVAEEQRLIMDNIVNYPRQGDMKMVRPSIRAMEMVFQSTATDLPQTGWSQLFWNESYEKTSCHPYLITSGDKQKVVLENVYAQIKEASDSLISLWFDTTKYTGTYARHDAAFGFCFYCLSIVMETFHGNNSIGITGRLLLRSILECRITFEYLASIDSETEWTKYRNFGIGQAKLALLKLEEDDRKVPTSICIENLKMICNEDYFQEYVNIDLGSWCGTDLRKMAIASGTKDIYDKYYCWTSTFAHGQWCAVRDTCMCHCLNPLHRYHRVPLPSHRPLEDTAEDITEIANGIFATMNRLYPETLIRLNIFPDNNKK